MDVLLLVHRIPFPPNKGDKIRSFHLLRALAEQFRVHLGTFIDDRHDEKHVPELERWCATSCVRPLSSIAGRIRSLRGLLAGEPLSVAFYRDSTLRAWVEATLARERIGAVVMFSSAMAQYASPPTLAERGIVDFVDIDSDKWRQYAKSASWPMRWVYSREARALESFEHELARRSRLSVVVSPAEREMLVDGSGIDGRRCVAVRNGVDVAYWDPAVEQPVPYEPDEEPVVFTGAMDYWANVDAVAWYAREIHPRVLQRRPRARFYIVGSNPTAGVRRLTAFGARVTGRVEDVRPYLLHSRVAVAPLRLARGVQNKVLEAMAMQRRVVATTAAVRGIAPQPPGVVVVDSAEDFAAATIDALDDDSERRGAVAREFVMREFDWGRNLAPLLAAVAAAGASPRITG